MKRRCVMVTDGISMLILQSKGYICALSLNLSVDARNSPRCDLALVGEVNITDHSCMLLSHDWVAETFLQLHVLLVGPVGQIIFGVGNRIMATDAVKSFIFHCMPEFVSASARY